jgi:hypothetical protein
MSISSELLRDAMGSSLTKRFGLDQLPDELTSMGWHETTSLSDKLIYTMVSSHSLAIASKPSFNASARFGIQLDSQGSVKFAVYTHSGLSFRQPDFVHNAREFMLQSFLYISEISPIPILRIIADWKSSESHFKAFATKYLATGDIYQAVATTWSGPIIMNDLGYTHVSADEERLAKLTHLPSIDILFSKK